MSTCRALLEGGLAVALEHAGSQSSECAKLAGGGHSMHRLRSTATDRALDCPHARKIPTKVQRHCDGDRQRGFVASNAGNVSSARGEQLLDALKVAGQKLLSSMSV
eukprot:6201683-Pleurochrysis_carterae.AAC.3